MPTHQHRYDVVVVGAGIVGLAHAWLARRAGLTVAVVDPADGVVGSSVQNFGHCCITAQGGTALEFATAGRRHWLAAAEQAGFWAGAHGTFVVARAVDELALLHEFACRRPDGDVLLLDAGQLAARVPVADPRVLGGAWMPRDLQVDPRSAAPALAAHLVADGVDLRWNTPALGIEQGRVHTPRGELAADLVVVAVNHDLGNLFPDLAERYGLRRCRLHMALTRPALTAPLRAPLFTGWSLVRYPGFAACPSAAVVRERLHAEHPDLVDLDPNLMFTQRPDGTLVVGDTHAHARSATPFLDERGFDALFAETRRLFGLAELPVVQRWQGVYCSAPGREFVLDEPLPGVRLATVTSGIGMTTAFGLAEAVLTAAGAYSAGVPEGAHS